MRRNRPGHREDVGLDALETRNLQCLVDAIDLLVLGEDRLAAQPPA